MNVSLKAIYAINAPNPTAKNGIATKRICKNLCYDWQKYTKHTDKTQYAYCACCMKAVSKTQLWRKNHCPCCHRTVRVRSTWSPTVRARYFLKKAGDHVD